MRRCPRLNEPAGRDGKHHINSKEDRPPPILWPLACYPRLWPHRSQTCHNTQSSPGPGGGHQILCLVSLLAKLTSQLCSKLTGELWSTYEKWRFQLFAGPNPRTNNARVLSWSQRRELLSLIISAEYSSRYKHNRSRQMCVFYLRSKEHFRYIGRITFMNWLSTTSENMNIDVQWRYYRILRSDYL